LAEVVVQSPALGALELRQQIHNLILLATLEVLIALAIQALVFGAVELGVVALGEQLTQMALLGWLAAYSSSNGNQHEHLRNHRRH